MAPSRASLVRHHNYLSTVALNATVCCITLLRLEQFNHLSAEILYTKHEDRRVFSIWNHPRCLSYLFPMHMNTYYMSKSRSEVDPRAVCVKSSIEVRGYSHDYSSFKSVSSDYLYSLLLGLNECLNIKICEFLV